MEGVSEVGRKGREEGRGGKSDRKGERREGREKGRGGKEGGWKMGGREEGRVWKKGVETW